MFVPVVKEFKIKDLRKVMEPDFQRWIDKTNLENLKKSIMEVGLQRDMIICKVTECNNNLFIIDGNHIRHVLTDPNNRSDLKINDNTKIPCKYIEVEELSETSKIFRLLNINVNVLTPFEFTNFYRFIKTGEEGRIYRDVWTLFGNPLSKQDYLNKLEKGLTSSTIIACLASKTRDYNEGKCVKLSNYEERLSLLHYIKHNIKSEWGHRLEDLGYKRPNGPSIEEFMNVWFNGLYFKYFGVNHEEKFIEIVRDLYIEKDRDFKNGKISTPGRSTAGNLFKNYLTERGIVINV